MDANLDATLQPGSEVVELTLPMRPRSAVTARLVAATLGAECGFDVDAIDDLRLAVDEAVGVVVDRAPHPDTARVAVQFDPSEVALTVRVSATDAAPLVADGLDPLATRIIGAMVDHFDVVDGALVLVKQLRRDGG